MPKQHDQKKREKRKEKKNGHTNVHEKKYICLYVGDKLYKRGAGSCILMKCVTVEEGKEILREAHEGTCGNHAASRTLVGKVFRSGFYWPTALSDVEALIKQCQGFQYFAK